MNTFNTEEVKSTVPENVIDDVEKENQMDQKSGAENEEGKKKQQKECASIDQESHLDGHHKQQQKAKKQRKQGKR